MEQKLYHYMSLQANEMEKVVANMEKEQSAILENNRRKMRDVLSERKTYLEVVDDLNQKIAGEKNTLGILEFDQHTHQTLFDLHKKIDLLANEINKKNTLNKLLLQLRVMN